MSETLEFVSENGWTVTVAYPTDADLAIILQRARQAKTQGGHFAVYDEAKGIACNFVRKIQTRTSGGDVVIAKELTPDRINLHSYYAPALGFAGLKLIELAVDKADAIFDRPLLDAVTERL